MRDINGILTTSNGQLIRDGFAGVDHTFRVLSVPSFPRVHEFAGEWAIEPNHLRLLWQGLSMSDLFAHAAATASRVEPPPVEMKAAKAGKAVAVVKIDGVMMKQRSSLGGASTIDVRRVLRQAVNDPNVSGVLLQIYSPGGTVAGTYDLAKDVRAARRQKPVWAFVEDLGASAAYWVASQAGAIYANGPTAMIGSIGTVMYLTDTSEKNSRDGVRELAFATGPLKAFGEGMGITPEQAAHVQSRVEESQTAFDAAVRSGRGLSAAELETVRSGAVFHAAEAQRLRLIDGIKSFDATLDALAAAK